MELVQSPPPTTKITHAIYMTSKSFLEDETIYNIVMLRSYRMSLVTILPSGGREAVEF
jgi:hypothetical protein